MDELSHFRLLLWLKLKLTLRQYAGSKGRLIGLILVAVSLAPMSVMLAIGTHIWLSHENNDSVKAEAIHFLYFGVFLLWVTSPILGFRANEFFDTTKLFIYPVSHRTVFLVTLTGSLTNGMLLFFLPTMVASTLTLRGESGAVACRVVLLLPALVILAQSAIQVLTLALLNLLRSRRFRDLAAILAALFGASVYLGFRLFAERLGMSEVPRQVLNLGFSKYLFFSPSYWISRAAVALPDEGITGALSGLVPVAALTALLVWIGVSLQKKAFFGEIPFALSPKREAARARREAGRPSSRFLPDDVGAIFAKELRLLRREPAVKTQLISQASYLVIPLAISILMPHRGQGINTASTALVFPGLLGALALAESFLFLNLFGLDGPGINLLLATPMPRRRILFGKDLAYVALFGILNTLILVALSLVLFFALGRTWEQTLSDFFFYSFVGLTLIVVMVSLGNVFSVFLPMRILARGRRALSQQNVEREGCGKAFLRAIAFLGVLVYLSPVAFVLLLPQIPGIGLGPWFYFVSIPFAIAYAGATWVVSLRMAESWFEKKEAQLLSFYTTSPQ